MNDSSRITKWLHKSDLEWLESEKRRLEKKGWSVIIETANDRYSLWRKSFYSISNRNNGSLKG
jgi:regulation of enolase protein 1 (concanavalin A-like superfamily)